jgi:hypothetical protein
MRFLSRVSTVLLTLQSIWLVLYGWLIALSTTGTVVGSDFGMMIQGINLQAQMLSWLGLFGIWKLCASIKTS